jgi:dephospho-CoA kinase
LGAGKSEALRLLGELGAETLSTDAVVHELYSTPEVRDAIADRFGTSDRTAIAERVFGNKEETAWLEGLLWPLVGERVASWRASVAPDAVAVVEVPLLFESGMEAVFDATIAVIADESVRSARASARGHAAVEERAARQLSQQEKADRADFVVRNDGSLEELKQTLSHVLAKLDQA